MMRTLVFFVLIKISESCNNSTQPPPASGCRPTEAYKSQPNAQHYCDTQCPDCPASHCDCDGQSTTISPSTSGVPSTSDSPSTSGVPSTSDSPSSSGVPSTSNSPSSSGVPSTSGSPGSSCRPTSTYASQPGMDTWCQTSCPRYCPESHCICDGQPTTSAPTTETVTTDSPTTENVTTGSPTTTTAPVTTDSPTTTTAPVTTDNVTTNPATTGDDDELIKGYYSWSWANGDAGPEGSNASCYFNGWNTVSAALQDWSSQSSPLQGEKYFSIGGGNNNGVLNAANVNQFIQDIDQVKSHGFDGVMFDIEKVTGAASDMNPIFADAFQAVKDAGMKVGITVSHTAPYDCDTPQDAVDFMQAFVADTNVDLMSPQLYTSGNESSPDFAVTGSCAAAGCNWDIYQNMHSGMKFVPSVANANQYDAVEAHFTTLGLPTHGYFQWQQTFRRALII